MKFSLLLLLSLSLAACRAGGSDALAADAGVDLGTSDVDAGVPTQTIDEVTLALGVAAALAAPLAPDGTAIMTDPAPMDTATHTHAEHGFSGSSVVTPMGCAAYSWMGLTATVTLTGCTLEALAMPVSGSVSLGVMTRPTKFTVTFTGLAVGTTTFDGNVALTMNGTDATAMPPTLDVDMTFTSAGTSKHLTASGISVTTTVDMTTMMLASIAISGSATLTSGGTTTSLAIAGLTWPRGDCLPTSGTVTMTAGSAPATLLTFLPTTPMDGKVTVKIGTLPALMEMLFTACS